MQRVLRIWSTAKSKHLRSSVPILLFISYCWNFVFFFFISYVFSLMTKLKKEEEKKKYDQAGVRGAPQCLRVTTSHWEIRPFQHTQEQPALISPPDPSTICDQNCHPPHRSAKASRKRRHQIQHEKIPPPAISLL